MPDSKITALTSIGASTDPANDPLVLVDVSDTSMAATGTTKKVTLNQLLGASGTATLASATITGDLTVDTSTLKVDSANNRVGIGTASPGYLLDVQAATAVAQILSTTGTNAAYLQVSNTGGVFYLGRENSAGTSFASPAYSAVLYAGGAYPLVTTVNGSERYRIASDGVATWSNVGGVGSTAMTLNSTGLGVGVTPSAWGGGGRAFEIGFIGTGIQSRNNQYATWTQNAWYNASAQWVYGATGLASRYDQDAGTHKWFIAPSGTGGLSIGFTQAMTLDASGNLLVGTTSAGGRLDVQTATGDCAARIKSNAAGSNATLAIDYVNSYGTHIIRKSGTDVWLAGVIADTGATPNYKIQNGSAVGVQLVSGATAWTTLSDETVKDIIEPIGNAVAKVGSLRSVIGKFKTDSEGTRRSFLIAQDVKSVLPEAVDVVGENNELGLRYTEVIPLLVAAIKELTARVEALEA